MGGTGEGHSYQSRRGEVFVGMARGELNQLNCLVFAIASANGFGDDVAFGHLSEFLTLCSIWPIQIAHSGKAGQSPC